MSGYEKILVDQSDSGVLTITLNAPDSYNALTHQMSGELMKALKGAGKDPAVRAIILTGAGKGFCAGQNLSEVENRDLGTFSFREHLNANYNKMVTLMRQTEKPIIVAVNGACAGAGFGLALAGDIRYASDRAKFLSAFIGIGLVPDSGVSYWLPRLIGPARAAEMMFTNDKIDGATAETIGLINKCVPHDTLMQEATALAEKLANGPTQAIGLTKRVLNKSLGVTFEETIDYEAYMQDVAGHNGEYIEGVTAFREKRAPNYRDVQ